MNDIIERIDLRFRSVNSMPVERAHITADEWRRLRGFLPTSKSQALRIAHQRSEPMSVTNDEEKVGKAEPVAWMYVQKTEWANFTPLVTQVRHTGGNFAHCIEHPLYLAPPEQDKARDSAVKGIEDYELQLLLDYHDEKAMMAERCKAFEAMRVHEERGAIISEALAALRKTQEQS